MPEIDPELARLIALGLLAILVLLLLAILASLGRLRKSVESASVARSEPAAAASEPRPEMVGTPPVEAAPEPVEEEQGLSLPRFPVAQLQSTARIGLHPYTLSRP